MTTPAVIYAARSKTDEDRNESTASQIDQIREALPADRTVTGDPHVDYASGSKSNRGPGLAAAIQQAAELADQHGECELWVFHSSRLGRGTGRKGEARALGHLLYQLRALGVTVRSVTDPEFTGNEQLWGIASDQASKYSRDLSAHVKRGYVAAAARGTAAWLARGPRTGGYHVLRSFDDRGKVVHEAIKHPEDAPIFELIWRRALEGRSAQSIQLELSTLGAMTRPARSDHRPRPFDANRVNQILDNAVYAGLVVHHGEVVGEGRWPRYIEPEDFFRLRAERAERCHATKRANGRPAATYLLSLLAVCAECGGPMRAETYRRTRNDSTRSRVYVCQAHREHHRESREWCPAPPVQAELADTIVLGGLDLLLADVDRLRQQLDAGRHADRERLRTAAAKARSDAQTAERVVARATARYEKALAEGDEEGADINLTAVRNQRVEAERARKRLNAALDALNAEPAPPSDEDVVARLWEILSGRLQDAAGDVARLNAALRETFQGFRLDPAEDELRIVPILAPHAIDRAFREWVPGRGQWSYPPTLSGSLTSQPSLTSQKASVRPSKATMSSSPHRVR